MVTSNLKHYMGRGTEKQHGLGPTELKSVEKLTKKQSPRLPPITSDRLLKPRLSPVGPGSYSDESKLAFPASKSALGSYAATPSRGGFGRERRDTHFAKYGEQNVKIYNNGLL